MKKILTITLFVLTFSQTAYAYGWRHHAMMNVTPGVVTATVANGLARPIVCSGQAFGRTYYGNVFNTWMNSMIVWPGQTASAWVYTNFNDRFVQGWANIWCRWY